MSGGHHESYGSTGQPYDVLAVTDDAADVTLFCDRKGMNAASKVQSFKDVIRLVGTNIWTADPTEEQRRLTLLVLHAWTSHAAGEATNCSLLTPQHACGGMSWLRATAMCMEAGALASDGTTSVAAGDPQTREANIQAICMWLITEEVGPIPIEEQRCRLLNDEECEEFRAMHLDCSSVCRGRCGYTNGAPKQAVAQTMRLRRRLTVLGASTNSTRAHTC